MNIPTRLARLEDLMSVGELPVLRWEGREGSPWLVNCSDGRIVHRDDLATIPAWLPRTYIMGGARLEPDRTMHGEPWPDETLLNLERSRGLR